MTSWEAKREPHASQIDSGTSKLVRNDLWGVEMDPWERLGDQLGFPFGLQEVTGGSQERKKWSWGIPLRGSKIQKIEEVSVAERRSGKTISK